VSGFARRLATRARGADGAAARLRLAPRLVPATAAGREERSDGVPPAALGGGVGESIGRQASRRSGAPPARGDAAAPARPARPAAAPQAPASVRAVRPAAGRKHSEKAPGGARVGAREPVAAAPARRAVRAKAEPAAVHHDLRASAGTPTPTAAVVRAAPRTPAPRPATAPASAPPIEVRIGRVEVGVPAAASPSVTPRRTAQRPPARRPHSATASRPSPSFGELAAARRHVDRIAR
jgi:hypothetical protein